MKYVSVDDADTLIGEVILVPRLNPEPMLLIDVDEDVETLYVYDIYREQKKKCDMTGMDDVDEDECIRVPTNENEFNNLFTNFTVSDGEVTTEMRKTIDSDADLVIEKDIQIYPTSLYYTNVRIINGEIDTLTGQFTDIIEEAIDHDVLDALNGGTISSVATIGIKNDTVYWCDQDDPFFERNIRDVCIENDVWGYGTPDE